MEIFDLRCDNLSSPTAVGSRRPIFSYKVKSDNPNSHQLSYRIVVASSRELLLNGKANLWDSGDISCSKNYNIKYNGERLYSGETYFWKVFCESESEKGESEIAEFGMGLLEKAQWGGSFIGLSSEFTPKSEYDSDIVGHNSPYLRHEFSLPEDKKVKWAKAFATSYGVYEMYLNGQRVGDYELAPYWTDYRKSLQYQCYNVTDLLKKGGNAVGAMIGDGWFLGNVGPTGRNIYGRLPHGFLMRLVVRYEDGTTDSVVTDCSWKATTGALIYTDNQNGEYYDATKELGAWSEFGYDDSNWHETILAEKYPDTRFKPTNAPAKVMDKIKPISIVNDKNGKVIVDMGQNMVGHIEMPLKGARGDKIVFKHGEMLLDDGTLYITNLRGATQKDTYVLKGQDDFYSPRFTFHGFRYVEIEGLDYLPSADDITGLVIYSDCAESGKIETSSQMVNKLFKNQYWGQRGNFLNLPTDCPQRDERLGWSGDAQIFAKSACYNMYCEDFYTKHMEDIIEAQKPNGSVTDVSPEPNFHGDGPVPGADLTGNGVAAWGDVIFVLPYTLYQMYGNTRLIRKYYSNMELYMQYLEGTTTKLIRPDSGYGDWLSVDDDTPRDVLATAYFAYDAFMMAEMARAIGKEDAAKRYDLLLSEIKRAFADEFVDSDVKIKGDTQCDYVLALKMNLLSEEKTPALVDHLIRTIERKNWHLSTGFVGVSYLLPMLSDHGHNDVAYKILLNETYPSWGYSIKNGATTIWERWNSYTKENGFGDPGMNSFNHYSLGSVSEWMYQYMGGIKPTAPGFDKIEIKPFIDNRLDFVKVSYDSIHGEIRSEWKNENGRISLDIVVPFGVDATVVLGDGEIHKAGSGSHHYEYSL